MITDDEAATQAEYDAWVATRPPAVRAVAARFRPWHPHRFKSTGRACTLYSFGEHPDGTVTLSVIAPQAFGVHHHVYGVSPDDVEEGEPRTGPVDPNDFRVGTIGREHAQRARNRALRALLERLTPTRWRR